ncbi:MAG: hypothetical protein OQK94_07355, partial [Gammaproteobacteria bacterium]|nr:hypothetical protein [Gammaproteobacteria bacterium]
MRTHEYSHPIRPMPKERNYSSIYLINAFRKSARRIQEYLRILMGHSRYYALLNVLPAGATQNSVA